MANMKFLDAVGLARFWNIIKSTFALKTEIPKKVSDLPNDAGYITSSAGGNINLIQILENDEEQEIYEYDPDTLVPILEGQDNIIYLVHKKPEFTYPTVGDVFVGQATLGKTNSSYDETNQYFEWIYNSDSNQFERIGEEIATNEQVEDMLGKIGFIQIVGIIGQAIIDESVVG